MPVLGICFAAVGLASTWSILGSGSIVLRSIVVLVIAGVSGGIVVSLVGTELIVFWTAAKLLHALFLLGAMLLLDAGFDIP